MKKEDDDRIPDYDGNENTAEEYFESCSIYSDFFLTAMGPSLAEDIVYQSNLYATQRGKSMNFKENEFRAFLEINFFMGYHRPPSYKSYWSGSDDFGVTVVNGVMLGIHFRQFLQYLGVNENTSIPANNNDKIDLS